MNEKTEQELRRLRERQRQRTGGADAKVVQLFAGAGQESIAVGEEKEADGAPKEKIPLRRRILQAIFRAVSKDDW